MIEDDIRTYLLTQSPITALVGTDAAGAPARISPNDRRQGITADSIVYQRVGTEHLQNLNAAQGYATAFIEFDCIGTTYAKAKTLSDTLRGELQGFRGTAGGITIYGCTLDDESDDFDPPADGSGKGLYHVTCVYSFQFTETVPTF